MSLPPESSDIDHRRLLIVWFSRTGACEQLSIAAQCAAIDALRPDEGRHEDGNPPSSGATCATVDVHRLHCDQTGPNDFLNANAYLFIAPENLASLAGAMKDCLDRCYYPVLGKIAGRAYAQIISAGSDGQGAVRQLARIATGWRLREAAEPSIVLVDAQTPEQILAPKNLDNVKLAIAREIGAALASGLALGIF